jgi:hypothetical protein
MFCKGFKLCTNPYDSEVPFSNDIFKIVELANVGADCAGCDLLAAKGNELSGVGFLDANYYRVSVGSTLAVSDSG